MTFRTINWRTEFSSHKPRSRSFRPKQRQTAKWLRRLARVVLEKQRNKAVSVSDYSFYKHSINWMWDKFLIVHCCVRIVPFLTVFCTNELVYCYCKPTKLQKCNVFSPVCLSVILSVHMMGVRCPLDMFKLGPDCTHCNNTPASKTRATFFTMSASGWLAFDWNAFLYFMWKEVLSATLIASRSP